MTLVITCLPFYFQPGFIDFIDMLRCCHRCTGTAYLVHRHCLSGAQPLLIWCAASAYLCAVTAYLVRSRCLSGAQPLLICAQPLLICTQPLLICVQPLLICVQPLLICAQPLLICLTVKIKLTQPSGSWCLGWAWAVKCLNILMVNCISYF